MTFSTLGSPTTVRLKSSSARVWRSLCTTGCTTLPDRVHEGRTAVVAHQHAVIGGVLAFVAVDEHQVERAAQRRGDVERRADVQPDFRAVRTTVEERAGQRLQFVIDLRGVEHGPLLQARGHGERRIPRERADLQHAARPEHAHDHPEQPPLDVPREHAGLHHAQVRLAVQLAQQLLLGCGVLAHVTFQRLHQTP